MPPPPAATTRTAWPTRRACACASTTPSESPRLHAGSDGTPRSSRAGLSPQAQLDHSGSPSGQRRSGHLFPESLQPDLEALSPGSALLSLPKATLEIQGLAPGLPISQASKVFCRAILVKSLHEWVIVASFPCT